MPWDPADFHSIVISILEAQSGKPIPLSACEFSPQELPPSLLSHPLSELFPIARDANAALSGLVLLAGHWDTSHQLSQDIESREGSYWHAIAHRIEPDSSNSAYWFRRVNQHPIFIALEQAAEDLLASSRVEWRLKKGWNPQQFLDWCDEARKLGSGPKWDLCRQLQRVECDLLFSWCALKTNSLSHH